MHSNPLFSSRGIVLMLMGAFTTLFVLLIYSFSLRVRHPQAAHFLTLASPGLPISAVGVALLRSPLRRIAPVSYMLGGLFHFLVAGGLVVYALWQSGLLGGWLAQAL